MFLTAVSWELDQETKNVYRRRRVNPFLPGNPNISVMAFKFCSKINLANLQLLNKL